jgi:hypothetical protein
MKSNSATISTEPSADAKWVRSTVQLDAKQWPPNAQRSSRSYGMPRLEADDEAYLWRRVAETGGEHRKVKWIGRRGAPDDLVGWPNGRHVYVELKCDIRYGLQGHQLREHDRMRSWGMDVRVIWGRGQIDALIEEMTK